MATSVLYKNPEAKTAVLKLYESKLAKLDIAYEERDLETAYGNTHVIILGESHLPPLVSLHGIHAGAPVTLEALKGLQDRYRIFAIDSIGQATKSAETKMELKDNSFGIWLAETMDKLGIEKAPIVGVSYGAFILQRLMAHAPEKVEKGIFVVPSGLVDGPLFRSMKELTWPLIRFMITKKDKHLIAFMDAFYKTKDKHWIEFQRLMLTQVKVDYRKPPLLKPAEVAHLEAPVYALVAENDIFFPGQEAIAHCQKCFKNFKGSAVLKGGKHIPDETTYPEIEAQIGAWLAE